MSTELIHTDRQQAMAIGGRYSMWEWIDCFATHLLTLQPSTLMTRAAAMGLMEFDPGEHRPPLDAAESVAIGEVVLLAQANGLVTGLPANPRWLHQMSAASSLAQCARVLVMHARLRQLDFETSHVLRQIFDLRTRAMTIRHAEHMKRVTQRAWVSPAGISRRVDFIEQSQSGV